jgi:hypothetical protein
LQGLLLTLAQRAEAIFKHCPVPVSPPAPTGRRGRLRGAVSARRT